MNSKKLFLRTFFVVEIAFFTGLYIFGPYGMQKLMAMHNENNQLDARINELQAEIVALQTSIEQWHENPFYKEKIAREKLQMAYKGDTIYMY